MASNEGLSIRIAADLREAIANFVQLGNAADGVGDSIESISSSTTRASSGLDNLATSVDNASSAFNELTTSQQDASNALNSGLGNVSNNLNRLSPAPIIDLSGALERGELTLSNFAASSENAGNAVGDLGASVQRTSVLFPQGIRGLSQYQSYLQSFIRTATTAGVAISTAGGQMGPFARATQSIQRPTINATAALTNIGRVFQDLPFGFIAISNNIDPLIQSLGSLSSKAGGVGGALKALGSSLAGPAGIALGVSVLVSGITSLIQKYGSLNNALTALDPTLTAHDKLTSQIAESQKKAVSASADELAKITLLYNASQDLNIPLEQRRKIVDKLQQQYPDTFAGLTKEAILAGQAAAAYDDLKQQIIATALIKGAQDGIAGEIKKIQDFEAQIRDAQATIEEYKKRTSGNLLSAGADRNALNTAGIKTTFDATSQIAVLQQKINGYKEQEQKIQDNINRSIKDQSNILKKFGANALGISGFTTVDQVVKALNVSLGEVDSKAKITGATAKEVAQQKLPLLNKAFNEIADLGGPDAQSALAQIGAQIKSLTDIKDATKIKTVAQILKEMQGALNALDAESAATGMTFDDFAKAKITILQKAFQDLIKIGLKPTAPEVKKIGDEINNLGDKVIGDKALPSIYLNDFDKVNKKIKTLNPGEIILPGVDLTNIDTSLVNVDKATADFQKKIKDMQDRIQAQIDKTQIRWGNISAGLEPAIIDLRTQISSALAGVADAIGTGIGQLVNGGGSLQDILKRILSSMGSFLQGFGKSLIEAGTLALIAQKQLISNPYLAIAAGIGAVAIGQALKNSVPSFATGAIVTSPTLAMVGDNPGRKEAIIPSEMWDKIGGGYGNLSIELPYDRLVIRLDETRRRMGR